MKAENNNAPTVDPINEFCGTFINAPMTADTSSSRATNRDCLAAALMRLAAAKRNAETTTARLQLTIRKSAEIAGIKTTEKKIESEVMQTQEHADVRDALTRAELEVEGIKLTLRALERKERMLDLLGRKAIRELDAHRVL